MKKAPKPTTVDVSLRQAAQAYLDKIEQMTTEEFAWGTDRDERLALRAALDATGEQVRINTYAPQILSVCALLIPVLEHQRDIQRRYADQLEEVVKELEQLLAAARKAERNDAQ